MVTAASRHKLYRKTLVLAAAVAASAAAAMASAATPAAQMSISSDSVPSIEVRYGDLNLTTEEGTHRLYQRITRAAEQVCPAAYSGLSGVTKSHLCQKEAIARAVATVNNPALASLHAALTRHG